jgi:hypothetical protein
MKTMKLIVVFLFAILGLTFCQDDTFNKVMHFPQGFTVGTNPEVQLQPYLGGASSDVTWQTLEGKPEVFPAEPHTHVMADITDKPTQIQLVQALERLGFYLNKTTEEINAITPPNGFGIAYDRVTTHYMFYSGGKWETVITDR